MHRSLTHYWRMNLAVIAGVAVTTAVLTGALLVGDSLRGSLRSLTLDRLGTIEQAALNNRFFSESLARRFSDQARAQGLAADAAPLVLLQGSVVHPDSERRASAVQVIGIDEGFAEFYPESRATGDLNLNRRQDQVFPSVVINQPLMDELGAAIGDDLLLSFGRPAAVPSASLLGRREQYDLLASLRATIVAVLPAAGPGRFGLEPRQNRPLNAFVDLAALQQRIDRPGEVNAMLVGGSSDPGVDAVGPLDPKAVLPRALELGDLGIELRREPDHLSVESAELVLRPAVAEAVMAGAASSNLTVWPYLTYLANSLEVAGRTIPYSTVGALQLPVPADVGRLSTAEGAPVGALRPDQVALNTWAAARLEAKAGDALTMSYFVVDDNDQLSTETHTFEVGPVVTMDSLGADPSLTPDVPGISDAGDIAGWDPPFPVDLERVGPEDEAYWDEHRGAPKAFVNLETGQQLWRSRYGALTSIRLVTETPDDLGRVQAELEQHLLATMTPEMAGFQWLPVRQRGLEGASGTTDFASLFLGFSLFLIVSAALLVGLLFALLVEQRGREAGLLLATGFPLRSVRRRFLTEGLLLAAAGTLLGTLLAILYTRVVLDGLTTWWAPVLDSPILRVHLRPVSLLIGAMATMILVALVISWTVRRVSRVPIPRLLAGQIGAGVAPRGRSRAGIVAIAALALAALLLTASLVVGMESAPGLFFGVGAALVLAGIAGFSSWSQRPRRSSEIGANLVVPRLAARNSARNLGRSLLSITLVASASFVLVSVSASRKRHDHDPKSLHTGTGGFTLVAEADTPLPAPIGQTDAEPGMAAELFSLRLLPGDDASCLNLYQPEQPRVVGVSERFIARGGFEFRDQTRPSDNPWELLHQTFDDGAVPAIGDYNSVRWILHSGLGQDLLVDDDHGGQTRLRLVGLLDTSIFQSELLISDAAFRRHFPDHTGFAFFLGSPPPAELESTAQALESSFSSYGLDAGSALTRLRDYQAVENMYLTTFEVLGGLGMLLGTVGLGIVLLRNTLERRGELATLRAFGYRRSTLAWMVVAENALLLVAGLFIGSLAGLIAVAPHLIAGGIEVPWTSLALVLLAVFAVGLLSSIGAVMGSLRIPLLPALKTD